MSEKNTIQFRVSVIIPVYNHDKYLRKAVISVINLTDVAEIILVDDGSTDNSLQIGSELEKEFEKIKLLRHPDGKNHGVSASRNLGIRSSTSEYIAFLDADDYYLEGRFDRARELFFEDKSIDGVYDAAQYEDDFNNKRDKLYSITDRIEPNDLFFWLLRGKKGFFCTNTITVKRALLDRTGLFLESLRMHEDSELWLRLAYFGKIAAGVIDKPVAIIRRHESNAIHGRDKVTLNVFHQFIRDYYVDKEISRDQKIALLSGYWRSRSLQFESNFFRRLYYYLNFARERVKLIFGT